MKKQYRLLKNYQFNEIISLRKIVVNNQYFIYYQPNQENHIRIGISVPKKIVKKAVVRNKIKRQIRNMLVSVNKDYGFDLIVIIRKNYLLNNYEKNYLNLYQLLTKIFKKEK